MLSMDIADFEDTTLCSTGMGILKTFTNSFMERANDEMIFSKVFRSLDVKDLFNCRLVCRDWAEMVKILLSHRIHIKIDSTEKLDSYISHFKDHPDVFTNFFFQGQFKMTPSLTDFFSSFGPFMTGLFIRNCVWMGSQIFEIMQRTPNLYTLALVGRVASEDRFYPEGWESYGLQSRSHWPKVKNLTIDLRGFTYVTEHWTVQSNPGQILTFIHHLLLAVPNVESVNCPSSDEYFKQAVTQTLLFKDDVSNRAIKKLDFHKTIGVFELKCLRVKSFPLTQLDLVVNSSISMQGLHSLLVGIATTLAKLKLFYEDRWRVVAQYFPSSSFLTNLKEVHFTRYNGNLSFLEDFISLRVFVVEDVDCQTVLRDTWGKDLPLLHQKFQLRSFDPSITKLCFIKI